MKFEEAVKVIEQGVEIAISKGAYSRNDIVTLDLAIRILYSSIEPVKDLSTNDDKVVNKK